MSSISARTFDASAIAVSTLCLVHCLALPLLAASLPLFGIWAEDERVHLTLVLIAVPLTSYALLWRARRHLPLALRAVALLGLLSLIAGAIGWPHQAWETPITVVGCLMLASAHVWNLLRYSRA